MEYINNEIYLKYLEMVQKDGLAIKHIPSKYQTNELCMTAVKQNGWALRYVEEQTPEICLEAVKKNGLALKYVEDRTTEICMEAVKQNKDALKYVANYELITKIKNELIESNRKE